MKLQEDAGEESGLLVLHQEFMTEPAEKYLRFRTAMTCNQIVYTKHEKLPVTGLYRMDGKPAENGVGHPPAYDGTLRRGGARLQYDIG